MHDIFVPHIDAHTSQNLINLAKENGYNFFGTWREKTIEEIIKDFYKYNHGNCKIIWHFFYNTITGKKDITATCKSIKETYPQLKNIPLTYYFGMQQDFFGEVS